MIKQKSSKVISSPFEAALSSISFNSSVLIVSPNSFATLLKLWILIVPDLSSSKRSNILAIPSLVSLLPSFAVMASRNWSKFIPPQLSGVSRSAIIQYIVGFLLSNPRLYIAAFNSLGSIIPEPSVSNKLNASLISSISSSVSPGLSKAFLLTGDFYAPIPLFAPALCIFK